jgi:uncharacterized protein
MDTISFDSHGTACAAWYLRADGDDLAKSGRRPCVVMGHGFGATRDSGLLPFADRFAAAGADVLAFDYRGFGTSDGTPRQDVNHRRHRQDYHAAVATARSMPGVDTSRIVLWGSSYSGGHVVAVAAEDPSVAAVISQGAAMDGLAALREIAKTAGVPKVLVMTGHGLRDTARAIARRSPHLMPVVGRPGSLAAITAVGGLQGYQAIVGPTFRNEMCARGILKVSLNRPVRSASKLRCPILLVVAEQDNIAPASSVYRVARHAGPLAEVESFQCGHFDIYTGEVFEKSVSAQVDFLRRHLLA